MNNFKSTYPAVDYVKFLCAVLIVGNHTNPFIFNFWLDKGFGLVTRLALPYFFIASSYFLFRKMDFDNPGNFNVRPYIIRLLLVYGIWSLAYLPIKVYSWINVGIGINEIFVEYIKDILFLGTYKHLWFMPALILGIIAVYTALKYCKINEIFAVSIVMMFLLTMFTTYLPVVEKIFDWNQSSIINTALRGIESFNIGVTTNRMGFLYGFPYIALGALFAFQRKKITVNSRIEKWILFFVVSMIGLAIEGLIATYVVGSRSTIIWLTQVPATASLFVISLISKKFIESTLSILLRKISILIYFSHFLFVELFEKLFVQISDKFIFHPILFISVLIASVVFSLGVIKLSVKCEKLNLLY